MNDYQSIPDANDIYAESRALHITSPSPPSDAPPSSHAPSSIATQCGLLLLGFLLGYLCAAALPPQTIEIGESLPRASSLSLRQSLLGPAAPPFPPPPTKPHLLYHASEPAFALLFDPKSSGDLNEYALDHFLLTSGGFDAQIHQTYCAVASVAALLNSLRYAKRGWTEVLPVDVAYDPYRYATQADVLEGECVARNVTASGEAGDGIRRPPYGLNLRQTVRLLQCRLSAEEWEVTMREVDPARSTLAQVRYELKAALIDPDARVLVNYDRRGLNQVGGGHFSPLGAYHAATDSFLVMDVAKYKYPPVWVGADTLMDAMGTMDDCGWYDFPGAQERLGNGSGLLPPMNGEEYATALEVLGCQSRRRGYIIVKKKP